MHLTLCLFLHFPARVHLYRLICHPLSPSILPTFSPHFLRSYVTGRPLLALIPFSQTCCPFIPYRLLAKVSRPPVIRRQTGRMIFIILIVILILVCVIVCVIYRASPGQTQI
jgi:hypothetical protein